MFLKNCLLVILLMSGLKAFCKDGQQVKTRQDSINALLAAIQHNNTVTRPYIGKRILPSDKYYCFWFLEKMSTEKELIKYATGENASLRVFSLASLKYHDNKKYNDLRKSLLLDTGKILVAMQDTVLSTTVAKYIKTKDFDSIHFYRDSILYTVALNENAEDRQAYFRLLVSWPDFNYQTRSDTINAIKKAMRERRSIEAAGIGFLGMPSKQYHRYYFLKTICTTQEWLEMVNDSSACIRLYSYYALKCKGYNQLDSIKHKLSSDTTVLHYQETCVTRGTTVARAVNEKVVRMGCENHDFISLADKSVYLKSFLFQALLSDKVDDFIFGLM